MKKIKIFWTIKELYDWACENNLENDYTLFTTEEGIVRNVCEEEIIIDEKDKTITL